MDAGRICLMGDDVSVSTKSRPDFSLYFEFLTKSVLFTGIQECRAIKRLVPGLLSRYFLGRMNAIWSAFRHTGTGM